jgi:predicted Zn finger-like uncharacterized protein
MILICPLCESRYLIAAHLFADGPRRVRCARCTHSWQVVLDGIVVEPPPDLAPPPESVAAVPEGSALPAVMPTGSWLARIPTQYLVLAGIFAFILFWLIMGRVTLAKEWPFLEAFYEKIGLTIYHAGDGLSIVNVRSEQHYEEGLMKLVIEGKIANRTRDRQKIPAILASAVGSDGDVMQSWQIDPPTATLSPGETVSFSSSIKSPKGTIVQINLNFVEPKHDAD